MRRQGVIEESQSPWVSPAIMVRKKDASIRFCVNYRNSWFSTLDLKRGYWQIKIRQEDKKKTAFSIGNGLWQFTVMSFGLCNAPTTFERLMERVLKELLFNISLVYLDDVIIFGESFEDMLSRLRQVFSRLRSVNLKLNSRKCSFFKREIKYLGHVVSQQGVTTDPEKIATVENWPIPQIKKQVRSFLGFCFYYKKFVKGFLLIAKPLFALTENLTKFVWTKQCEIAFIQKGFYWATCKQDVEDCVDPAEFALLKRDLLMKGRYEMQIYNAGIPFEKVQLDVVGPFPTSSSGNKYLLVITDCFTKWVEAFSLKNVRAKTIAKTFVNKVTSRFGVSTSSEVHTDQGRNFGSRLFRELSHFLGIKKTRTTPEKLNEIHDEVRQRLKMKSLRSRDFYDRKARQLRFEPRNKVWLYNPR
ncbi:hypothetical protein ACFW04_013595 [Cataglyphis niger]